MAAPNSALPQPQFAIPPPSQDLNPVQAAAQAPAQVQFPAQPQASAPATSASSSKSLADHLMCKNRLQEYTQKSGIPLPTYQTVNEGYPCASSFRSSVSVDGVCYTSPNLFPSRKAAEQDVAMLALSSITERIKDEEVPALHEVTVFSKTILYEYAMKRNIENPTYKTFQRKGSLPVFISSLVFNGVAYTGDVGKNKREAEQLAARAAIQSLLGDSESGPFMAEIVKSKSILYDALYKFKDPHDAHANLVPPAVNIGPSSSISTSDPNIAVPKAPSAMLPLHLDFTKQKQEKPDSQENPQLPITFVPAVYDDSASTPFGVAPTSLGVTPTYLGVSRASKKRRKNKKKSDKIMQNDAQLPVATMPLNHPAPCSVTQ